MVMLLMVSDRAPWGDGGSHDQGKLQLGIKPTLPRIKKTARWSSRTVCKTTAVISLLESSVMCFLSLFSP